MKIKILKQMKKALLGVIAVAIVALAAVNISVSILTTYLFVDYVIIL